MILSVWLSTSGVESGVEGFAGHFQPANLKLKADQHVPDYPIPKWNFVQGTGGHLDTQNAKLS